MNTIYDHKHKTKHLTKQQLTITLIGFTYLQTSSYYAEFSIILPNIHIYVQSVVD